MFFLIFFKYYSFYTSLTLFTDVFRAIFAYFKFKELFYSFLFLSDVQHFLFQIVQFNASEEDGRKRKKYSVIIANLIQQFCSIPIIW